MTGLAVQASAFARAEASPIVYVRSVATSSFIYASISASRSSPVTGFLATLPALPPLRGFWPRSGRLHQNVIRALLFNASTQASSKIIRLLDRVRVDDQFNLHGTLVEGTVVVFGVCLGGIARL